MGATKLEGANGSVTLVSNNPTDNYTVTAPNANGTMALTSDLKEIGVGQTWQDVTGSRVAGTIYTNSTGKPILVNILVNSRANALVDYAYVDSIEVATIRNEDSVSGIHGTFSFIVPNNSTYYVTSTISVYYWSELR